MKTSSPSSPFASALEQMQRVADDLDRMIRRPAEDLSKQLERMYEKVSRPMQSLADDVLFRNLQELDRILAPWQEASKRWARALLIVRTELPKRGWYLTGEEPITLVEELAQRATARDWTAVDKLLVEQAVQLRLKDDLFQEWLVQQGVPGYSIARVRLVLEHRESNSHTVTAVVGMTVIDELCRFLYDGREFTTKRHRQPRPQLACRVTTEGARALSRFASGFVEVFGSIQEDIDPTRLADEDYFNRHAILHGKMRREYGPKDSAKVFMVLMFLVLGGGG
jgi:hypothetical protein